MIKAKENTVNNVLGIKGFTESSELVSARLNSVHEFGNGAITFGGSRKLILQLFNMATAGQGICFGESIPESLGCGSTRDERDKRLGDGADKGAEKKFILPKLEDEFGVSMVSLVRVGDGQG